MNNSFGADINGIKATCERLGALLKGIKRVKSDIESDYNEMIRNISYLNVPSRKEDYTDDIDALISGITRFIKSLCEVANIIDEYTNDDSESISSSGLRDQAIDAVVTATNMSREDAAKLIVDQQHSLGTPYELIIKTYNPRQAAIYAVVAATGMSSADAARLIVDQQHSLGTPYELITKTYRNIEKQKQNKSNRKKDDSDPSGDGDKNPSGDGDKNPSGDGDKNPSGDGDKNPSGDGDKKKDDGKKDDDSNKGDEGKKDDTTGGEVEIPNNDPQPDNTSNNDNSSYQPDINNHSYANNTNYTGGESKEIEVLEPKTEEPVLEPEPTINTEKGNTYSKIPVSTISKVATETKSNSGNSVIPVLAGISAAAAAGIGAKAYMDKKKNSDNESNEIETEEWSEDNSYDKSEEAPVDSYSANSNKNAFEDISRDAEETLDDDYSYAPVEEEKYGARNSSELSDME